MVLMMAKQKIILTFHNQFGLMMVIHVIQDWWVNRTTMNGTMKHDTPKHIVWWQGIIITFRSFSSLHLCKMKTWGRYTVLDMLGGKDLPKTLQVKPPGLNSMWTYHPDLRPQPQSLQFNVLFIFCWDPFRIVSDHSIFLGFCVDLDKNGHSLCQNLENNHKPTCQGGCRSNVSIISPVYLHSWNLYIPMWGWSHIQHHSEVTMRGRQNSSK